MDNKNSLPFSKNSDFQKKILNRFIQYVKINTQSDGNLADKGIFPSTPHQKDFSKKLLEEIKSLGIKDALILNECYVNI